MRVVLSGYYGFDNAGDEALLTAITSALRSYEESIDFTVLSGNPRRTEVLHGLRAVSRVNPLVLLRELKAADLLISGGGSLLQDVTGPLSIPYYLGVTALAKLLGTPVVFYAQGVGPVNKSFSKYLIKLVANRMNLITLRDEDSAHLLESMGVNDPPVLVTADPVFSMNPDKDDIAEGAAYLNSLGLSHQASIIGVSLRNWEGFSDEKLAAILDSLADLGYSVLLLPMQHPEDLVYSRKVGSLMKNPPVIADKPMSCLEL
ncbi:MAG: polysaccharide pyruvyl transferase CsaB, partial [Candidatus Saccharibacteria bacterium]